MAPSAEHASDHDYTTPPPSAVRDELLTTTKPSGTYRRKRPFNLLLAFCRDNDMLLTLVSYLPLPSLISLYSISKTFHYLYNRHHTAFILSSIRTWAPGADRIFPWRSYQSLCTSDPLLRLKQRHAGRSQKELVEMLGSEAMGVRNVPSLRWLQMVVWREGVTKDMLIQLATKVLRCPHGTHDAVKVS